MMSTACLVSPGSDLEPTQDDTPFPSLFSSERVAYALVAIVQAPFSYRLFGNASQRPALMHDEEKDEQPIHEETSNAEAPASTYSYGTRVKSDIIDVSRLKFNEGDGGPGLFETLKRHEQMTIAETIEVV